jgi:hypothetical protein
MREAPGGMIHTLSKMTEKCFYPNAVPVVGSIRMEGNNSWIFLITKLFNQDTIT